MFRWFLKLLGIDEDRPAASNNSLLNSPSSQATAPTAAKSEPKPKPKPKPEPKPAPVPKVEEKAEEKPAQQAKPKETPAKPAAKSLTEDFPGLKANFAKVLTEAGFDSKKAIEKASDKELLALKGIGQATIKLLRN